MGLFLLLANSGPTAWFVGSLLPGAAPDAPCPGYRFIAVCGAVARTDAQHRLREIQPLCALLPGAAPDAPCPGYRFIAPGGGA